MVALLDDVTVLDDENDVGVLNGRKAMGNDKAGATLHEALHGRLDLYLGARVDVGGRLVEDEHRGLG